MVDIHEFTKAADNARCAKSAKSAVSSGWPLPPAEAAFTGLAGDVVRLIEPQTESDPAGILLQFLATFGAVCGRDSYVQVEADRHPPQIWPVMVGNTSKGRKGTSWGRVKQLIEMAAHGFLDEHQETGLSSGEGLIWRVRDPIIRRVKDKETGAYEEQETDAGVTDKRLLVVESEFATPLRHIERSGNTLSGTIRNFWDTGNVASLTKTSPARTTGASITIIGHVTVDELRRYMTATEMGNGFANRFIFACVRRSKELPFGGAPLDLEPLGHRVAECLGAVAAAGERRIHWTDAAKDIWRGEYSRLSAGRPGMTGAITSRSEAQTLRLALVYALLDRSAYLEPEHLQAGLAVWDYVERSTAFIFGAMVGDPMADAIYSALRATPEGLTRNEIRDLFSGHKSSAELDRALLLLVNHGLVFSLTERTGGRASTRWRLKNAGAA